MEALFRPRSEVGCIGNEASAPYEFGVKASIVATTVDEVNRGVGGRGRLGVPGVAQDRPVFAASIRVPCLSAARAASIDQFRQRR